MIIDKVKPFWTDEDRQRLEEIRKKQEEYITKATDKRRQTQQPALDLMAEWRKWQEEEDKLWAAVEDRYFQARTSKEEILADVEEIVAAIEQEDFTEALSRRLDLVTQIKEDAKDPESTGNERPLIEALKTLAEENHENCCRFILANLRLQEYAFQNDEDGKEQIRNIVSDKASLWYERPQHDPLEALALEYVQPIKSEHQTIINNALINFLTNPGEQSISPPGEPKPYNLPVSNKKGHPITTCVLATINTEDNPNIEIFGNLNEWERQVLDGVITLWVTTEEQNIPCLITPNMIYENMPGAANKADEKTRTDITNAVDKLRSLHIAINATDELLARKKIKEGEVWTLDDKCLSAIRLTGITENGHKKTEYYKIKDAPLLLQYNRMTGQIIDLPRKCYDIKKIKSGKLTHEPIAMTQTRIAILGYTTRRIAVMKNDLKKARESYRQYEWRRKKNPKLEERQLTDFMTQKHSILFDTLFSRVGIADQIKQQAARNRNFVFDILDYEAAIGWIKRWEKKKDGQRITGVKIFLE